MPIYSIINWNHNRFFKQFHKSIIFMKNSVINSKQETSQKWNLHTRHTIKAKSLLFPSTFRISPTHTPTKHTTRKLRCSPVNFHPSPYHERQQKQIIIGLTNTDAYRNRLTARSYTYKWKSDTNEKPVHVWTYPAHFDIYCIILYISGTCVR